MTLDDFLHALEHLIEDQESRDDDPGEGNFSCEDCRACNNCRFCVGCDSCEDCTYCEECIDCTSCTQSKRCVTCQKVSYCDDSRDCKNSRYLTLCVDCNDCVHCLACVGIEGGEFFVLNEKRTRKEYFALLRQVQELMQDRMQAGWRPPNIGLASDIIDPMAAGRDSELTSAPWLLDGLLAVPEPRAVGGRGAGPDLRDDHEPRQPSSGHDPRAGRGDDWGAPRERDWQDRGREFVGREPPGRDHGREPMGREPIGREPMGREPLGREHGRESGREPVGREPLGREPVGREPVGREPVGREPLGREHGREPLGREPLGREPVGREPLGREHGRESGREPLGREHGREHGREPVGREPLGREPLGREHGRELVGREPLGREPLGREPLGREPMGREPLGREPPSHRREPTGSDYLRESGREPIGREPTGRDYARPVGDYPRDHGSESHGRARDGHGREPEPTHDQSPSESGLRWIREPPPEFGSSYLEPEDERTRVRTREPSSTRRLDYGPELGREFDDEDDWELSGPSHVRGYGRELEHDRSAPAERSYGREPDRHDDEYAGRGLEQPRGYEDEHDAPRRQEQLPTQPFTRAREIGREGGRGREGDDRFASDEPPGGREREPSSPWLDGSGEGGDGQAAQRAKRNSLRRAGRPKRAPDDLASDLGRDRGQVAGRDRGTGSSSYQPSTADGTHTGGTGLRLGRRPKKP